MKSIKAFIKRYPLLSYFALTFAISWGAILIAVGFAPGGFSATPQQFQKAVPYAVPAMVLGTSVAGILSTVLLDGRVGLREFRSRLLKWRVGARWYAVALLTAPLVFTAVLIPLSLISPVFRLGIFASDARVSFVVMNMVVALEVGILEELGWTGRGRSWGDVRDVSVGLWLRIGSSAVDSRCSGRLGPRRASLASATTPKAGGLRKG